MSRMHRSGARCAPLASIPFDALPSIPAPERSAAEDLRLAAAHCELPGIEPPPRAECDDLVDDMDDGAPWGEWTEVPIECLGYTLPTRPGDRGYTMTTLVSLLEIHRRGGAR